MDFFVNFTTRFEIYVFCLIFKVDRDQNIFIHSHGRQKDFFHGGPLFFFPKIFWGGKSG